VKKRRTQAKRWRSITPKNTCPEFPWIGKYYQKENFHFNLVFLQWVLLDSHVRVSNILSTPANQVECWPFTLKK